MFFVSILFVFFRRVGSRQKKHRRFDYCVLHFWGGLCVCVCARMRSCACVCVRVRAFARAGARATSTLLTRLAQFASL